MLVQIDSRTPQPLYKNHSERRHLISERNGTSTNFAATKVEERSEPSHLPPKSGYQPPSRGGPQRIPPEEKGPRTKSATGRRYQGTCTSFQKNKIQRTRSGYRHKNLVKRKPFSYEKSKRIKEKKKELGGGPAAERNGALKHLPVRRAGFGWLGSH